VTQKQSTLWTLVDKLKKSRRRPRFLRDERPRFTGGFRAKALPPPAAGSPRLTPGLAVAEPAGLDFDAPRFPNWPAAPAPPAPRALSPTQLLTPASVSTPPPPRREIAEPPTPYRPEPAAEAYAAPPPLPSLPTEEGL